MELNEIISKEKNKIVSIIVESQEELNNLIDFVRGADVYMKVKDNPSSCDDKPKKTSSGRPSMKTPELMERIKAMHESGVTHRDIAETLQDEGIKIAYTTVGKWLMEEKKKEPKPKKEKPEEPEKGSPYEVRNCPECSNKKAIKKGARYLNRVKYQVWQCQECKHKFEEELNSEEEKTEEGFDYSDDPGLISEWRSVADEDLAAHLMYHHEIDVEQTLQKEEMIQAAVRIMVDRDLDLDQETQDYYDKMNRGEL